MSRPENPNGQYPYRNLERVLNVEPGDGQATQAPTSVASSGPGASNGGTMMLDDPSKRRSMERQTALKVAAQLLPGTHIEWPKDPVDSLLAMADRFHGWIAQPDGAADSTTDDEAIDDLGKPAGDLTFDDFWGWVTTEQKKTRRDVDAVLGMGLGQWLQKEKGSLERAKELLRKAWGS